MNTASNLLLWLVGACALGFVLSAFFATGLKASRRVFLIPYVLITSAFLYSYFSANPLDLRHHLLWGILAGIVLGAFLVRTVFAQPASRTSTGFDLAFDLLWAGAVYGVVDGLFLNVFPVMLVMRLAPESANFGVVIGLGSLGLAASLLVTLAYHLGYAEFRNRSVGLVLFGNALITLAYLLSGNPLGAVLSHAVMHIAAVVRGAETTIQLPPHHVPAPRQAPALEAEPGA